MNLLRKRVRKEPGEKSNRGKKKSVMSGQSRMIVEVHTRLGVLDRNCIQSDDFEFEVQFGGSKI